MQKHTKVYFDFFRIDHDPVTGWHDHISCEICGNKAVDIHHINGRWNKDNSNNIENLIALCRRCHEESHANELTKGDLHVAHFAKINKRK